MAVISITITESPVQKVAGVPTTIELSASIPSTIFYTLDGTDPTTSSDIYISAITMPNLGQVTLKVFATDGTSSSAIVTEEYGTNMVPDRQPRDKVTFTQPPSTNLDLFPFGDHAPARPVIYGNTGGVDVDDPNVAGYPTGFDGTATDTAASETDKQYHRTNYDIEYSERNSKGEYGEGIGTLPATVNIVVPPAPPEQSDANSKIFNSRALVIVQDGREEPEDPNVSMVNKQFFSLGNDEVARDGAHYRTTALEGAVATGSFLKYHYNPREDIYTFYYRDAESNRWIISKEPRRGTTARALSQMAFPSSGRAGPKVFKWIPFKRSRLI